MKRPDLDPSRLRTIDDVLRDLDRIIEWSLEEPSRLGYFAALYRKVTQAQRLAALPSEDWSVPGDQRSHSTARLGREIVTPGPFLMWGLLIIRMRESNDIRKSIETLAATPMPAMEAIESMKAKLQRGSAAD